MAATLIARPVTITVIAATHKALLTDRRQCLRVALLLVVRPHQDMHLKAELSETARKPEPQGQPR